MQKFTKIGPYMSVPDDFVTNMQDAYEADNERGSHHFNNLASEELNKKWPTVVAMAALIEQERDSLKQAMERTTRLITQP